MNQRTDTPKQTTMVEKYEQTIQVPCEKIMSEFILDVINIIWKIITADEK